MYARVARYDMPPERIGEAVEHFREAAPKLEALDGIDRGFVMIDDENGSLMTVTFWKSRSALEASDTRASLVRQGAARAADGAVQSVGCYEVVVEMNPAPE
jgi:heme-degrading monooxygenase HmoA